MVRKRRETFQGFESREKRKREKAFYGVCAVYDVARSFAEKGEGKSNELYFSRKKTPLANGARALVRGKIVNRPTGKKKFSISPRPLRFPSDRTGATIERNRSATRLFVRVNYTSTATFLHERFRVCN